MTGSELPPSSLRVARSLEKLRHLTWRPLTVLFLGLLSLRPLIEVYVGNSVCSQLSSGTLNMVLEMTESREALVVLGKPTSILAISNCSIFSKYALTQSVSTDSTVRSCKHQQNGPCTVTLLTSAAAASTRASSFCKAGFQLCTEQT